jgi:hypothetical protein
MIINGVSSKDSEGGVCDIVYVLVLSFTGKHAFNIIAGNSA